MDAFNYKNVKSLCGYRGTTLDVFNHNEAVYGLSTDPCSDSIFASACDDGRICIYDIRAPPSEGLFTNSLKINYLSGDLNW